MCLQESTQLFTRRISNQGKYQLVAECQSHCEWTVMLIRQASPLFKHLFSWFTLEEFGVVADFDWDD